MNPDRERHYQQAMEVARAAWDYCNPPDGDNRSSLDRFRLLRDEVHKLRRLELELAQDNNLHAALYSDASDSDPGFVREFFGE